MKLIDDNSLAPTLDYVGNKIKVKFDGSCLKQDKITFTHGTIVNIYIVYELTILILLYKIVCLVQLN